MSGSPPPAPPPGGGRPAKVSTLDTVDTQLELITIIPPTPPGDDPRPIECLRPTLADKLKTGGNAVMDAMTRNRLLTTMVGVRTKGPDSQRDPKVGGVAFSRYLQPLTLKAFNDMAALQQMATMRRMWEYLVTSEVPNTAGRAMYEPDGAETAGNGSLPSSLMPLDRNTANVTLARRSEFGWARHGIGFRLDGKKSASEDAMRRWLAEGCRPLAHNAPALLAVRGMDITGLPPDDNNRVFFWYGNRDVFNETATCVARSLLGATAFPLRSTNSAALGVNWHYLLALSVGGKDGVDSEGWQHRQGKLNHWRPGEKAFLGLGPERIVAWTKLLREPGPAGGGWRFMFPERRWNYVNIPSVEAQAYMTAELEAWNQNQWYEVPGAYDFAA